MRSRVSPLVDTRVTTMVFTSLVRRDLSSWKPNVDEAERKKDLKLINRTFTSSIWEKILFTVSYAFHLQTIPVLSIISYILLGTTRQ